jgi:RND family efflux transporter MFP subunit
MMVGILGCSAQTEPKNSQPRYVPLVRIVQVRINPTSAHVDAVGTVALRRESQLGFTTPGRIAQISVNEGETVRAGQFLATLDTTIVGSDLARAVAEQNRATNEYRRSVTLAEQGWVTKARVESAKATLVVAQTQVRTANFQLAAATVVAPGPGMVMARLAEPGEVVAAGTPIVVLGEATSGFVLRASLTDRDAARIRRGASAIVTLNLIGVPPLSGRVIEVGGRAERTTGTFLVEVGLPSNPVLRSGQIGVARIILADTAPSKPIVPSAAVFSARAGEGFVYIVDGATQRVRLRKVIIGNIANNSIELSDGVRPGDWVATSRVDRPQIERR